MFKGACRLDDLAHRAIILFAPNQVNKVSFLTFSSPFEFLDVNPSNHHIRIKR